MTRQDLILAIVEAEQERRHVPLSKMPQDFYSKRSKYQKAGIDIALGGTIGGAVGAVAGGVPGYVAGHTVGGPVYAMGKYTYNRGPKGVVKDYRKFRTHAQSIHGGRVYNAMVKKRSWRREKKEVTNNIQQSYDNYRAFKKAETDTRNNIGKQVAKAFN